jgi:4a-hydroxytetrahydrobiopterin dehydratase
MATLKKMSATDVGKRVEKFQTWTASAKNDMLTQTFEFSSAVSALAFAAKVTLHAEILNHHPTIELNATKVKIKLQTHDVKGLTSKDFELAKKIDGLKL